MAVVLREAANPHEPVQRACAFIAVHGAKLEESEGQFSIALLPGPKDQAVDGAVHGLGVIGPVVHFHGRVHAVGVEVQVTRCLEQLPVSQMRGVHKFVPAGLVPSPGCSPP